MPRLADEFERLIAAARNGSFEVALRNTELATAVARRHPLNFLVIKTDDGAGTALRLHLWNMSFKFGQSGFEVHNHVFDIDSFVIDGCVRQTIYAAEADTVGAWEAYQVSYDDAGSSLVPTHSRLALRAVREDVFTAGDRYKLSHGMLHSLRLLSKSAVTLVLTRAHEGAAISVGPYDSVTRLETDRSIACDPEGRPLTLSTHRLADILSMATT
jgi:hypothetical protein